MARENDILAEIDKADPTLTNSRLSRWMRQNHDALTSRLSGHRIVWSVLVKVFTDAGLVDARGNPPTEYSARKTWQRVRREVALARKTNSPRQPPIRSVQVPTPPVVRMADEQDDDSLIIEPASKFHSRPAVSRFKPKGPTDGEKT